MHIYAERKVKNLYIIFLQNRNGIWQHLLSYKCFIIIAFHHNSYFSPLDTSLHRIISPSDASFPDYYPLTAVIPYSQMACSILSESLFRLVKRTVPHHETACSMHREKAFTVAHYAKTLIFNALHLCPIIRVYGHSLLFSSSHAILSDFNVIKHSFSHDIIAWICICSSGFDVWITSSIFCSYSAVLFPHGVTLLTVKTRRLRSSVSP